MPVLKNPRHERFAQARAKGRTLDDAMREAGYKSDRRSANKILTNSDIVARIAEIQSRGAEKAAISKAWVLDKLRMNAERALQEQAVLDREGNETGEFRYEGSVANRALELIGKELGMFVERKEVGQPGDFANLSREELGDRIADEYRALGFSDREARRLAALAVRGADAQSAGSGGSKPH